MPSIAITKPVKAKSWYEQTLEEEEDDQQAIHTSLNVGIEKINSAEVGIPLNEENDIRELQNYVDPMEEDEGFEDELSKCSNQRYARRRLE